MATALNHFVPSIETDIIVFVLLEQVIGTHLVAVQQQVLGIQNSIFFRYFLFVCRQIRNQTYIFFEMNGGTLQQSPHQLVWIPCHGLSSFNACHTVTLVLGQQAPATPCRINVQPETILLTNVSDGMDGIECPDHSRSLRAVHEVGSVTEFQPFDDESFEFRRDHPPPDCTMC